MQKGDRYALVILITVGCSGITPAVLAEEQADLFDLPLEQLEQMVVTAQNRSANLQEVPVSISAFSGDNLLEYGVHDIQSLQVVTPSLVFNNTGSSAQPYLRGVGTRFAFAGLEPSVATYLDDRYVARAQATLFELADVERVEILRGPQGTLYGRNATGGAIRVLTKGVDDELSGSLLGTVGDYDLRALSGTVNLPLGRVMGTRITALVKKRDGYADNLDPRGVPELDDRDTALVRGKLRWDLSDRVSALLTLQYSEQDDNAGNDVTDLSPPGLNEGIAEGGFRGRSPGEVATAIDSKIHDEEASVDLRFDVNLPWADFVSITTYHDFEQTANSDADGTSSIILDAVQVPQDARAFSQELHLLSVSDGPWQWITGLYFFDERADFELLLDRSDEAGLESQGDQRAETT
ncbi:MAG: TonB-dependent receptor plug domain-containing protein, partial [Gammaproteobacteria bacterium]